MRMAEQAGEFSRTVPLGEYDAIEPDALAAWLAAHVEGLSGPITMARFGGGQSNPTYAIESPTGRYVLRRKPPGVLVPGAHAVDREFRILSALGPTTVPVPRARALCLDDGVIGTAFYVMDRVEGRVFWDPELPDQTPAARAAIYGSLAESLAALHNLDPAAVGLGDFGGSGNYLGRQLARWTKQYRSASTCLIPALDWLADWLAERVPPQRRVSLVHGDYNINNVIIDGAPPRVAAILDWELSTLGDPLVDFAYHLLPWRMPRGMLLGMKGAEPAPEGVPTEAAYVARYCTLTGQPAIEHLDVYVIFCVFRIAAILQGILRRSMDGTASSAQAREVGSQAVEVAGFGCSLATSLDRGVT